MYEAIITGIADTSTGNEQKKQEDKKKVGNKRCYNCGSFYQFGSFLTTTTSTRTKPMWTTTPSTISTGIDDASYRPNKQKMLQLW